jgi:hypothetical protein
MTKGTFKVALISAFCLTVNPVYGLVVNPLPKVAEGGDIGGGGALFEINGAYLSFGTAQNRGYIKVTTEDLEDVPGLEVLDNAIENLALPTHVKGKLQKAYWPSPERRYYRFADIKTDAAMIRRFEAALDEYKRELAGEMPIEKIRLDAFTNNGNTILFEEFFLIDGKDPAKEPVEEEKRRLKSYEQAAKLEHEANRVLRNDLSLKFILKAEINFQRYLEKGNNQPLDTRVIEDLEFILQDPYIGINAAAIADATIHNLPPMTFGEIFGADAISYLKDYLKNNDREYSDAYLSVWPKPRGLSEEKVFNAIRANLKTFATNNPNYWLPKQLLRTINKLGIYFYCNGRSLSLMTEDLPTQSIDLRQTIPFRVTYKSSYRIKRNDQIELDWKREDTQHFKFLSPGFNMKSGGTCYVHFDLPMLHKPYTEKSGNDRYTKTLDAPR